MSLDATEEEWKASVEWSRIVAACLIKQDDKYLLVQEAGQRARGLWNLPAGHVDKGETIEAAAIREAREETGLEVRLVKEVGLYHERVEAAVKHVFEAEIIGGKIASQNDEILAVAWLSFEEIKNLSENQKLRAPWIWAMIQKDHNPAYPN